MNGDTRPRGDGPGSTGGLPPWCLTAQRLDPQLGLLRVNVALCTPQPLLNRLVYNSHEPLLDDNGLLRRKFGDARVAVTLTGDVPAYSRRFEIGLRALSNRSSPSPEQSTLVPLGSADLPVIGQASSYPLDWFSFAGYYNLHLPLGVSLRDEDPRAQLLGPVQVRLRAGPGVGDFRLRGGRGNGGQLQLRLDRERSTQTYVIVVLAIPPLFALLLALGAAGIDRAAHMRDALLGTLAATLALLPIRQVLVPNDVYGLTLVDWVLGATVLLFASAALRWIGSGRGGGSGAGRPA